MKNNILKIITFGIIMIIVVGALTGCDDDWLGDILGDNNPPATQAPPQYNPPATQPPQYNYIPPENGQSNTLTGTYYISLPSNYRDLLRNQWQTWAGSNNDIENQLDRVIGLVKNDYVQINSNGTFVFRSTELYDSVTKEYVAVTFTGTYTFNNGILKLKLLSDNSNWFDYSSGNVATSDFTVSSDYKTITDHATNAQFEKR